jgi:hypothetical protein
MLALHSMTSIAGTLSLVCHPQTPARAIRGIAVSASGTPGGILTLSFSLTGDLRDVRIPEPRSSGRLDGLWRHTCFEAFVMTGEGPGYREFNFSPSGEWAGYAFLGYRYGGKPVGDPGPVIRVRRSGDRLVLDADIRPECLPSGCLLRLGLSAVVENADGMLSYWALQHPPGKPDFHHTDAFSLPLVLPGTPDAIVLTDGVRP